MARPLRPGGDDDNVRDACSLHVILSARAEPAGEEHARVHLLQRAPVGKRLPLALSLRA
eukprot:CAMPEP_0177635030 /NCGR_PEP_ID=MMETSP0447-20121125/3682_1 /TAXON_ID=0 /ORGANISM="Stygamoeba regulata, Strain BSH-02190019" /LENGTH=58 /DNA_ID=CAMNT_0019136787 /DNA_START=399 /DNA_END=572 /DNA_ORIENTATION=+